jgi:DNA invertase Pin-like site-specific DNA recombinase
MAKRVPDRADEPYTFERAELIIVSDGEHPGEILLRDTNGRLHRPKLCDEHGCRTKLLLLMDTARHEPDPDNAQPNDGTSVPLLLTLLDSLEKFAASARAKLTRREQLRNAAAARRRPERPRVEDLLLEGKSIERVVRLTGVSRSTVWRCRKELVAAGRLPKKPAGHGQSRG